MKKGRIFVVSAPSGCGKTTVCKRVLRRVKKLTSSVSMTTRKRRRGEKNKKDYYYVSHEAFRKEIKKRNFLEWKKNFKNFYGTPKHFVLNNIKKGKSVLLSIDVKGAMQVKKKLPQSVFIFLKPPSMKELSRRLRLRNTDGHTEITNRLKIAKKEMKYIPKYNYVVVNKNLKEAVNKIVSIIKKEV